MEIIDNLEFEKDNLPEDYYEKNLEKRRYLILLMFVLL